MPTQVDPTHNLNSLILGTAEFSFAENALTAAAALAAGYLDFGNCVAAQITPELEKVEHFGSYRGKRRKDKTVSSSAKLMYQLRFDEWNHRVLPILFGADAGTNFTQSAQSSASADTWAFATTNSGTEKWYDVLVSGARIRKLTALTIATLTEGTDFVVDYLLGRVKFLVDQSSDRTATISASAITSSDADYFVGYEPLSNITREGFGRLTIYDQNDTNKVVIDHVDFSCEISVESNTEIDGQAINEVTLNVEITDTVGNILSRAANAA